MTVGRATAPIPSFPLTPSLSPLKPSKKPEREPRCSSGGSSRGSEGREGKEPFVRGDLSRTAHYLTHTHTPSSLPPCRPPDPSSSLFVRRLILDRVNECRFSGKKFPRKYRDDVAQSRRWMLDGCTRSARASIKYVSSDARGGRLQQVGP